MVYTNQFWCLPRWEKFKWQTLFLDSQTLWVRKSFSFSKTLNKSSPLVTISFPPWRWLDWNPWSTVPDLFYQKHKIRNTCIFIKSCSDYGISLHIYTFIQISQLFWKDILLNYTINQPITCVFGIALKRIFIFLQTASSYCS